MVLSVIFFVIIVVLLYLVWVLQRKISALENVLLVTMSAIDYVNTQLKAVDIGGSFESDDEIGFVFREIQDLVTFLHKLVIDEEGDSTTDDEVSEDADDRL